MPTGLESPVPEKKELYQSSRSERHSQGARAGSQEGQGCPHAPRGTKRGTVPWGEGATHCGRSYLKGCSAGLGGPGSSSPGCSGRDCTRRGLHARRSTFAAVQALEPRALGDTAQHPVLPWRQAEARRTQDSKDAPATRQPQNVQIRALCPWSNQAPADWELR